MSAESPAAGLEAAQQQQHSLSHSDPNGQDAGFNALERPDEHANDTGPLARTSTDPFDAVESYQQVFNQASTSHAAHEAESALHSAEAPGRPVVMIPDAMVVDSALSPTASDMLPSTSRQHAQADAAMIIAVGSPESRRERSKLGLQQTYTTYAVETRTTLQSYPNKQMKVARRFRDFEALHGVLRAHLRGHFVPPLPDKNFVEGTMRANDDFTAARAADLQQFLTAIAQHESLREFDAVRLFLSEEGALSDNVRWQQMRNQSSFFDKYRHLFVNDAAVGGSNGSELEAQSVPLRAPNGAAAAAGDSSVAASVTAVLRRVRDLGTIVRHEVTKSSVVPEDEARWRQLRGRCRERLRLVANASRAAEACLKECSGSGTVVKELGIELMQVYKFEEKGALGRYTEMGACAAHCGTTAQRSAYHIVAVANAVTKQTNKCVDAMQPLHAVLRQLPEAMAALQDGEHAFSTIQYLQQQQQQRAKAGDDALQQARSEYQTIRNRSRSDLERMDVVNAAEMVAGMTQFCSLQSQLCAYTHQKWLKLVAALDGTEAS